MTPFKHSVLVVIIKSVPNQIQSSFMRGVKGARRKKIPVVPVPDRHYFFLSTLLFFQCD